MGSVRFKVDKNNNSDKKNPTWSETTYALSNWLSRAVAPVLDVSAKSDTAKLQKISDNLKKKLEEMPSEGYGINLIRKEINEAIEADIKSSDSSYKDLIINGTPTVIRISNHSAKVQNFSDSNNNFGIVIKTSNHDFRGDNNISYLELMFYSDIIAGNPSLQKQIFVGLIKYLETGSLEAMPIPNRINASGTYHTILKKLGFNPTNKGVLNLDQLRIDRNDQVSNSSRFRIAQDRKQALTQVKNTGVSKLFASAFDKLPQSMRENISSKQMSREDFDAEKASLDVFSSIADKIEKQGFDALSEDEKQAWSTIKQATNEQLGLSTEISDSDMNFLLWRAGKADSKDLVDQAEIIARDKEFLDNNEETDPEDDPDGPPSGGGSPAPTDFASSVRFRIGTPSAA